MRWCEGRAAAAAQRGECREEVEMAGRRDGGGADRLARCGIAKGRRRRRHYGEGGGL